MMLHNLKNVKRSLEKDYFITANCANDLLRRLKYTNQKRLNTLVSRKTKFASEYLIIKKGYLFSAI